MKKLAAFILLLCIAAQTFSQGLIRIEFLLNQRYIAKNLCENRNRPQLHCDGKCILAKKLKEEEKKDQQMPERKMQGKAEVVSSRSHFTQGLPELFNKSITYIILSDRSTADRSFTIFHPPC